MLNLEVTNDMNIKRDCWGKPKGGYRAKGEGDEM
jgi:hypothetical protein